MEIVAPNIRIKLASFQLSSCPVHVEGIAGRYTLNVTSWPLGAKERLNVVFHHEDKPNHQVKVSVKVKAKRSLKLRKWERLMVHTHSESGEKSRGGEYRAFRLLRKKSKLTLLIFKVFDTANFMSFIPDDTSLGLLTLPGTHNSCAVHGYPICQCQQPSTPIVQQLLDGVRFLDIRLRVVGDQLLIYHGPHSQRLSLQALLPILHGFLYNHPTETIILSLKEESPPFHPAFSERTYSAFKPYLGEFWFLQERIPRLGEVRGKGILLTRFDRDKDTQGQWPEGMGIHPSTWPDSKREGFVWDCGGTPFRIQDWYRVKTFLEIPEKFEAIQRHLIPTLDSSPVLNPAFTLSYTTASNFPLSLPTLIAKGFGWPSWGLGVEGINSRLYRQLLEWMVDGKRVRGCLPMDFYRQCAGEEGLASLLIQMNFIE
ncbi:hypothetical protein L204_100753 [Cryptococcus depauperatus]|nr:hypothetical protein L204_01313 [Cryptococcus depauperatus CBS 7855]